MTAFGLWVLAFSIAVVSGQQTGPPPAVAATAAISGVVIDATTGQPLSGATVTLARIDTRGVSLPRMVTDSRGRFVFRNLAPGTDYYLGARRFGYAYTRYGWTAPGQSLTTADIKRITLTADQWISDLSIPLWRLGSISGRVVDERSEPVVGVVVRVFATHPIAGRPQLVAGPLATTDDRGAYRITGLEPSRYVVSVLSVQSTVLTTTPEAPQSRAVGELATGGIGAGRGSMISGPAIDVDDRHRLAVTHFATPPPPDAGQARAYPPTFFPGAPTIAGATPVDIKYGDVRENVDFQVRPVAAFRVSGRVSGPAGDLPPLLLRLMPTGAERLGFGSEAATTVVGADRTFTFLHVPEGSYTLMAQPSVMDFMSGGTSARLTDAPGFNAGGISVGSMVGAPGLSYLDRRSTGTAFWARASIEVTRSDVTGVDLTLHRAVAIRGRVMFAAGTEPRADGVALLVEPADGDPTLGRPIGRGRPGEAFTVEGLGPGRYVLGSFTQLGVVSATWNGRDVMRTGFDASAGQDFDDVVVTLTDKVVDISGTVRDTGTQTAAVIAFPTDRTRWVDYGWSPPFFRATRAGSNGAYRLTNLPEGEYFVIAVEASQRDAWTNPKFLEAAAPLATRLPVKWGESKTLNLALSQVSFK